MRSTNQIRRHLMYTLQQTLKDEAYLMYHKPTTNMYTGLYDVWVRVDHTIAMSAYAPGEHIASNFSPATITKVIDAFY